MRCFQTGLAGKMFHVNSAGRTKNSTCSSARGTDRSTKLWDSIARFLQQETPQNVGMGANLYVENLNYHPAGVAEPLLADVSLHLPANEIGLIFGRSGSGKTTLLYVLSGLAEMNKGAIWISRRNLFDVSSHGTSHTVQLPRGLTASERLQHVGMVFQFPERHFLGDTISSELTFGWPTTFAEYQRLVLQVHWALNAVGMTDIALNTPTIQLSDGFKRRLALAVQLVRQPSVLLLDEPLAGLDWKARTGMVALLAELKQKCTLLVVSHDLHELEPLADRGWEMTDGGRLQKTALR